MILVDANLLVYAVALTVPEHESAREWLDARLRGTARVGLAWPSLLAFMRLISNPRIFERPQPLADAWRQVGEWLALPTVWTPQPTERHAEVLGSLLERESSPALVPDAHLAALAIEHGLTVASSDGDFARFEGLRWTDPLREAG